MNSKKIELSWLLVGLWIAVVVVLVIAGVDQIETIKELKDTIKLCRAEYSCQVYKSFVTQCIVEDSNNSNPNVIIEVTYPKNVIPEEALDLRIALN